MPPGRWRTLHRTTLAAVADTQGSRRYRAGPFETGALVSLRRGSKFGVGHTVGFAGIMGHQLKRSPAFPV